MIYIFPFLSEIICNEIKNLEIILRILELDLVSLQECAESILVDSVNLHHILLCRIDYATRQDKIPPDGDR